MKQKDGNAGGYLKFKRNIYLIIIITVLLTLLAFMIYLASLLMSDKKYLSGFPKALSTFAIEIYRRDYEMDPKTLHILSLGTNTYSPVEGVMIHGIVLEPKYKSNRHYLVAIRQLMLAYNYISLSQACYLAMNMEVSPRVRYVLKNVGEIYQGSYETELYGKMQELQDGNTDAHKLFTDVESYGFSRIEWRMTREDLIRPLLQQGVDR